MILASLAVIISLSSGVIVTSCQKEAVTPEPELSKGVQPQADWTYLDFTEDFTGDFGTASDTDIEILMKAVERANLAKIDGWWEIRATSSEQIKMSPAVFEYVRQIVDNSNGLITEVLKNAELIPKTRQLWEVPGLSDITQNDCFACCVNEMGEKLGYRGGNYAFANNYVTSTFGDGVGKHGKIDPLAAG